MFCLVQQPYPPVGLSIPSMVVSGLLRMQQGLVQPRGSFWHADELVHAAVVTRNSSDCVHTLNNISLCASFVAALSADVNLTRCKHLAVACSNHAPVHRAHSVSGGQHCAVQCQTHQQLCQGCRLCFQL